MREVNVTGPTVEEAIESALSQLNITKDRAEITVIDPGKKAFFGLFGGKPAVVAVKETIDPVEEAKNFLIAVAKEMGVEASIEEKRSGREVEFNFSGEKMALLIGKRGQTLNALQHLAQLVANRSSDQFVTILLDAENYRARRRETLSNLAKRLADKALRINRPVSLEAMPSYERKVIHAALVNKTDVETHSEGREPNRYIVISPK
ncbi:RNA-binding cell elongation regulator Jag/EloR [Rossellomorea marisflavi]|uniref:RNA-binding cell elongation regulator Jag/EloR n=1 Tax=Rossellomorea marisflavi TaxID=189381 RepID=UPI0006FE8BCC|nr:RNA-binding cell elongation regulator Jag/EloR [Rossellomorea marisflavi]KQU58766.1 protein jag [Bacillus sp. Leaf406]WJV18932.1 RNA-binding cell elongation regulator Jag/EloR [Rossellomorea marisflavi]